MYTVPNNTPPLVTQRTYEDRWLGKCTCLPERVVEDEDVSGGKFLMPVTSCRYESSK